MNFLFDNFGKVWVAAAVLSVGVTGFGIWAVYKLVMHVTGG